MKRTLSLTAFVFLLSLCSLFASVDKVFSKKVVLLSKPLDTTIEPLQNYLVDTGNYSIHDVRKELSSNLQANEKNSIKKIDQENQDARVAELSDYDYIYHYYKEIESSLNRNSRVGKLGKITTKGLLSGTFFYHCRLTGWDKVSVTMIYENYSDRGVILNGNASIDVNWRACGTMNGTIFASGISKGSVEYDLKITHGQESDGFYYLNRQSNSYISKIPIALVLDFANRDITLDENAKLDNN